MSTDEETTSEDTTEASGPVVVHARTTTDEHYYVQFGDEDSAAAFEAELKSNAPGQFEFDTTPLIEAQDVLDAFPAPVAETEPVSTRQTAPPDPGGIPDDGTLSSTSRTDLDLLLGNHGLDPADYSNKAEAIAALQEKRDA